MKYFFYILLITLSISCKKKVNKEHKEFIGYWECKKGTEGFGIFIGASSNGYKYDIKNNKIENIPDSKNWFIKNNKLIWRAIFGESYTIDTYPTRAEIDLYSYSGDTVKAGQRYMKLNGNLYIERAY